MIFESKAQEEFRKEFEKIASEIFDKVKSEFELIQNNSENINRHRLSKFIIFNTRKNSELLNVWKVSKGNKNFHLLNVAYETTISFYSWIGGSSGIAQNNWLQFFTFFITHLSIAWKF